MTKYNNACKQLTHIHGIYQVLNNWQLQLLACHFPFAKIFQQLITGNLRKGMSFHNITKS